MKFRTVLLGAVAAIALMAGVWTMTLWKDVSSFVSGLESAPELCSVLDDGDRTDLMGVETPTRLKNVEGSLDSFTCRWATSDTSSGSFVQVVSAPAGRWAETVAVELRSLPPTGDPRRMRQLRQAASKPLETGADACRFARRLFEISGAQNGAERLVAQTLTSIEKPMVMAQSCIGGRYRAVMVAAPAFAVDQSLERKTGQALRQLEKAESN